MKRIKKYIYLVLFAIILSLPIYAEAARAIAIRPLSPSGSQVTGNQWLFVIGVDTYIHWPRLNTAVTDAKSVKDVLLSRYYFDKEHLIELYDEQATRKNILSKLRFLAKNVRRDDSLVIFYAGHGHLDSITKSGSWIPVESGTKDVSAWISNHDIKNYLRVDAIKAKHILLISDSCFSGDFFRGHRGKLPEVTDRVIKRAYKLTSRQAITSGGLEPVSDEGFGKNSIFSHFLAKTLRENQKPFLVPSDFFPDIKAGVVENAEQFPRFGSLIGTGGQQGGELVLFLKQASRLKAISTETSERKEELQHLKKLEAAAEEAKKKEAEEIAKHERELAELDARIMETRKRLGTPMSKDDDSLDTMFAMVEQKERQQKRIDELRKKREEEEQNRRAQIERLKRENKEKKIAALEEDIRKYKKIVSSPFGKDMKESAWKSLLKKYPDARGLDVGDTAGLLGEAKYGHSVPGRDDRFIAYDNGTVKDTSTGLMWAAKDNGKDINWHDAKRYCENYWGGGYSDWRMPTQDELAGIYDDSKTTGRGWNNHPIHVTKLIRITDLWVWSSGTRGSSAAGFSFLNGYRHWSNQSDSRTVRALPVRGGH